MYHKTRDNHYHSVNHHHPRQSTTLPRSPLDHRKRPEITQLTLAAPRPTATRRNTQLGHSEEDEPKNPTYTRLTFTSVPSTKEEYADDHLEPPTLAGLGQPPTQYQAAPTTTKKRKEEERRRGRGRVEKRGWRWRRKEGGGEMRKRG